MHIHVHVHVVGHTYRLLDGPVRELLSVTEMSEVEDITEELILKLRVLYHWHGTVLCTCVSMLIYTSEQN